MSVPRKVGAGRRASESCLLLLCPLLMDLCVQRSPGDVALSPVGPEVSVPGGVLWEPSEPVL